ATGFLGSHLLAALLRQGETVIALARSSGGAAGRTRVEAALAEVLGSEESREAAAGRLEVVEGDIGATGLGLTDADRRELAARVDEVWHSAASLSFLEEERAAIFRMNLDGARSVVDFTAASRGRRLHHISTA